MDEPVLYAHLRPKQFGKRLAQRPVAYLPMGTLEWHGEHMPFGTDMILSENLMVHCARRFGGIVLPPIYLGPDNSAIQEDRSQLIGMDLSNVTTPNRQLDGSCYWVSDGMFDMLIDAILSQVKRAGFSLSSPTGMGRRDGRGARDCKIARTASGSR
jgi:creatinine amidohydrolase